VFQELDKKTRGAGNETQLTDALNRTIAAVPFHGYRFEGRRYDCGTRVGFVEANVAFGLAHPEMGSRLKPLLTKLLDRT
jgi:UTP--glucose-1-phosphate uridylyltransferase